MKLFSQFSTLCISRLFFIILPLLIISCFSSGCQSIDVRGQFASDADIEEINSRRLSQQQIIDFLGTPTYVPEYSPNSWYYIQRSQSERAWFEPKVIEQRIVRIDFTRDGSLIAASLLSDIHQDLAPNANYTATKGTEQNGLQKFVKNIGRFNKTTDGTKKRSRNQNQ